MILKNISLLFFIFKNFFKVLSSCCSMLTSINLICHSFNSTLIQLFDILFYVLYLNYFLKDNISQVFAKKKKCTIFDFFKF